MAGQDSSAAKREEAAAALVAVLASAFPGDEALPRAVRKWIGFAAGESACGLCGRPHQDLAVQGGSNRPHLVQGADASVDAVCGGCLDAALETFAGPPKDVPSWDMLLAQLERALALVSEEHAAIARECLSKRPHALVEAPCVLCRATKPTAHSGTKGVCEACVREARTLMGDLAARAEVESGRARCPRCGSGRVAAGAVGIEFTELTCLSCGHSEICDVWQLAEWH